MARSAARTLDTEIAETAEIAVMSFHLPFGAGSAAVARQRLVDWLSASGVVDGQQREDARLVVSELVGNAVRHARPLVDGTMRVAWVATSSAIDIAITDGGALTAPERLHVGASSSSGRGLALVEILSSRWWVESSRSRTTVHAMLALV